MPRPRARYFPAGGGRSTPAASVVRRMLPCLDGQRRAVWESRAANGLAPDVSYNSYPDPPFPRPVLRRAASQAFQSPVRHTPPRGCPTRTRNSLIRQSGTHRSARTCTPTACKDAAKTPAPYEGLRVPHASEGLAVYRYSPLARCVRVASASSFSTGCDISARHKDKGRQREQPGGDGLNRVGQHQSLRADVLPCVLRYRRRLLLRDFPSQQARHDRRQRHCGREADRRKPLVCCVCYRHRAHLHAPPPGVTSASVSARTRAEFGPPVVVVAAGARWWVNDCWLRWAVTWWGGRLHSDWKPAHEPRSLPD